MTKNSSSLYTGILGVSTIRCGWLIRRVRALQVSEIKAFSLELHFECMGSGPRVYYNLGSAEQVLGLTGSLRGLYMGHAERHTGLHFSL